MASMPSSPSSTWTARRPFAPEEFDLLRKIIPPSHLLFGSDFSYFPVAHSVELFARLALPQDLRDQIASVNAASLLPRWKS